MSPLPPPSSPPVRINLTGRIRSAENWTEEPYQTTVALIGIALTRPDGRRMVQVNLGPNAESFLNRSPHNDLELYIIPAEGHSMLAGQLIRPEPPNTVWDIIEADELLTFVYDTPHPAPSMQRIWADAG